MKPCRKTGIFVLILLGLLVGHYGAAAGESDRSQPVQMEKTFDHGTLITHTLKIHQPPHTVLLYLNQRRVAEGADRIAHAHLGLRHEATDGASPMTRAEFDIVFESLMTALRDNFGPNLDLESLGSGGFLGVKEIEKKQCPGLPGFCALGGLPRKSHRLYPVAEP